MKTAEYVWTYTVMPRTCTFVDGTVATTRLSDETLAKQHGWEIVRDSIGTNGETCFVAWRLEPIEGSDGEYVHERHTAAIADEYTISFYDF